MVLVAFSSYLGHQSIMFAKVMAILEEFYFPTRVGFTDLEVESD